MICMATAFLVSPLPIWFWLCQAFLSFPGWPWYWHPLLPISFSIMRSCWPHPCPKFPPATFWWWFLVSALAWFWPIWLVGPFPDCPLWDLIFPLSSAWFWALWVQSWLCVSTTILWAFSIAFPAAKPSNRRKSSRMVFLALSVIVCTAVTSFWILAWLLTDALWTLWQLAF